MEYKKGVVIKVKDLSDDDENTSQYAQIQEVYVYHGHKVLPYCKFWNLRKTIDHSKTGETYACLYKFMHTWCFTFKRYR